jgi:hypothetical protein
MDLARLAVTLLGLGLIVAVNLYFFARPGAGHAPMKSGRPGVKPAPEPPDDVRRGR